MQYNINYVLDLMITIDHAMHMSIQLVSFESTESVLCMFVLSLSTPAVTEPLIPLMFLMSLTRELCRCQAGCRLEKPH